MHERPLAGVAGRAWALPLLAFLVALTMLFFRLGALPLAEPDEGRNAEVGREMMASGAWLVPSLDGFPYLDKPAFFFRSVAVSYSLFGVGEGAARLPSALAGLAIVTQLFFFCRRVYGRNAAALAVLVAATAPLLFAFSRIVIMDAMLGCFVCASIFAACLAEEAEGRARRLWYVASAAAAGLGTLVKGPVGFLIPALVITVFCLVEGRQGRRRGALRRCFSPLHLLVFFAVVLPWFVSLCLRVPGFLYYGLVEESFHRFTNGSFHRTQPFYFYLPIVFAGLFPWSLLLPETAVAAWKRRAAWSSADRLFAVWAVVVVVFFSLSHSKLPAYVLTAVVALAALLGRLLARALEDREGRAARIVARGSLIAAVLSALLAAALFTAFLRPDLFRGLQSAEHRYRLEHAFPPLAAGLALAAALALAGRLRRSPALAAAGLALFPLSLMTLGMGALVSYSAARSSKELAGRLAALPAGTRLAALDCFPEGLAFYRRQPLAVVDDQGSPEELGSNYLLFRWRKKELDSDLLVDVQRLGAWVDNGQGPVLLLGDRGARRRLETLAAAHRLGVREVAPGWWGLLMAGDGSAVALHKTGPHDGEGL